jgi:protein XagA
MGWGQSVLRRSGVVLFAVLCAPSVALAGAWTLPQGSGQLVTTVTASTSTSVFDDAGALTSTPRYNKLDADALLEYGVTSELTAMLQPGLQHIDIAAPTSAERTGLDYTEFGARYRFWQNSDWVLSGQALVEIPGTTATSNPAAIGYTDVQADFRVLLGHNFMLGAMPAFVDLEVAQHQRGDGAPNEFRADATLGVQVAPRWMVLAQSFNVVSEGSGSPVFGSYEYFKLQLSAVYALTPSWSLQGGGFTTYAGTNSLQENGAIFGIWYRF